MTEGCGIYGLPRKLINFLRQMEKFKETLKWNINEGPHKMSLTMTWSLNKERLSFVDRMKKTFRFNSSTWFEEGIELPKRSGSFRKKGQRSPERLCPFCKKTLPQDKGAPGSPWNLTRNSSLNRSSSRGSNLGPVGDANFNKSLTVRDSSFLNRSSWSGPRSPTWTSTPKKEICSTNRSELSGLHNCSNSSSTKSVRLTYRTVEDIAVSYEDLYQKAKEETSRQLDTIKKEWNKSIRKSSRIQCSSSSSASSTEDVTNSNGNPHNDVINQTRQSHDIPLEPHAPASPVCERGQLLPRMALEGTSRNHSNILHNDLSTHQRTSILQNIISSGLRRISYSTDIL